MLCFTEDTYRRIRVVVKGLEKNKHVQPSLKKHVSYEQRRKIHKPQEASNVVYEPTNIDSAHDSDYWRWKRVKAWFREFKEDFNTH